MTASSCKKTKNFLWVEIASFHNFKINIAKESEYKNEYLQEKRAHCIKNEIKILK